VYLVRGPVENEHLLGYDAEYPGRSLSSARRQGVTLQVLLFIIRAVKDSHLLARIFAKNWHPTTNMKALKWHKNKTQPL
jgi:hypothetical protein